MRMDHKKHRSLALPLGSLFIQLLWKTKTRTQRWASWHLEPVTMWWLLKQGCLSSSDLNIPLLMWMFWRRQSWSLPSIETPFHAETFWHFKQFFKNWKSFSSATVDSVLCYLLVFMPMGKPHWYALNITIHGLKTPRPKDDRIFTSA